ncbi:MAG: DNA polymerase domain-containing protein [Gemmatimonadetes bacterium]|nr:DNA polymerase domain-containing protein [Gemmatimonadota bacterium]
MASVAIEIAGVRVSNPDRILYEGQGITKRDLAEYYLRIERWVVPELRDRPLTLLRCPSGSEKECFFQRRANDSVPDSIRRVPVTVADDETTEHLAIDSVQGIIGLVQLGVLEMHTWGARRDRLDRPDRLVMDMDPAPELPFSAVVDAALEMRETLRDLGLVSFVKSTGGKGLHIVAPLARRTGWDELRSVAHAIATSLAERHPRRYLAKASKSERTGRVFIDYLRNGPGATAVASYSTRARPGAPVSLPLAWEELSESFRPEEWSVRNVPARLESLASDPWDGYARVRQSLTREIRDSLEI